MLSIAVASLSFDPPSQIAGAASVSVDPPSQIVLKDALFHVQNYFDGGLFAVGDRHMVSGTASLSGGDLTVKCGSGATGKACPGYSIHLGPGTLGPWFNHSAQFPFLQFKYLTTSVNYTTFPV